MKQVLITGGAGFIGSNLALRLIEKGYAVTVLDCLSQQIHGNNPEKDSPLLQSVIGKVTLLQGRVEQKEQLQKAIAAADAIVHLAAETGTGQSMYAIEHYANVNMMGTAILLDLLTNGQHHVKRVVVASSRAIYGEGKYQSKKYGTVYPTARQAAHMQAGKFEPTWLDDEALTPLPTDESATPSPSSVYAITKLNQEQMVMTVCQAIGVEAVTLRYQNVYGPGQSLSNPYTGILSIFSKQILNGSPINIFEDGLESRDFVYIDDVVAATVLALEAPKAAHQVFNVGTGVPNNVVEVVNALQKGYQQAVPATISGAFRLGDIRHNFADISHIQQQLGFQPQVLFEEGIARFTKWVSAQTLKQDNSYEDSLTEMKSKGLLK
jgi:dTDP-L-rhamnose 4-epimerase